MKFLRASFVCETTHGPALAPEAPSPIKPKKWRPRPLCWNHVGRLGCGVSWSRTAGKCLQATAAMARRDERLQPAHPNGARRCAFLFCTRIQSPGASGRRCVSKSSRLCVRAAMRSTIATSTPNPSIRSWVSRSGCDTITPISTAADRGLCRSSIGGGSAGPHLSGLERGVSRDPEGLL
jgi:hypothetical protein